MTDPDRQRLEDLLTLSRSMIASDYELIRRRRSEIKAEDAVLSRLEALYTTAANLGTLKPAQ